MELVECGYKKLFETADYEFWVLVNDRVDVFLEEKEREILIVYKND